MRMIRTANTLALATMLPTALSGYNIVGYNIASRPAYVFYDHGAIGRSTERSSSSTTSIVNKFLEEMLRMENDSSSSIHDGRRQEDLFDDAFRIANEIMNTMTSHLEDEDPSLSSSWARFESSTDPIISVGRGGFLGQENESAPTSNPKSMDSKFQVTLDVPGMEVSDLDVIIEKGEKLLIRGEVLPFKRDERLKKKFSRIWSLDRSLQLNQATAVLKNGVLTVTVPHKTIEERVQKIPVVVQQDHQQQQQPRSTTTTTAKNEDDDADASILQKFVPTDDNAENQNDTVQSTLLSLDIPGVAADNIDVTIEDQTTLFVRGERTYYDGNEQSSRKFEKSWRLDMYEKDPSCWKLSDTTASLKNGVLTIVIPKDMEKLKAMVKSIPVVIDDDEHATTGSSLSEVASSLDEEPIIRFSLDLPGVELVDIQVTIEDGKTISVTAERKFVSDNNKNEYTTKKTFKTWSLESTPVDSNSAMAKLKNGVLTIVVPKDMKMIEEQYKKIPIHLAEAAAVATPKVGKDAGATTAVVDVDIVDPSSGDDDEEEIHL